MSSNDNAAACGERQLLQEYAVSALADAEAKRIEAHLEVCARCAAELNSTRAALRAAIPGWPGEELSPARSLWNELARRIGKEGWSAAEDELELPSQWPDVEWEQPAPGVFCKVLSIDPDLHRVSLMVRLDPGAEYPPHTHAGVEELHLLDGELWIDDLKLYPGEYNRAEPGTWDKRVWSQTGCSCVLVTSTDDLLG